jgi:hypothetical protein
MENEFNTQLRFLFHADYMKTKWLEIL